jgi:hypothetical protein
MKGFSRKLAGSPSIVVAGVVLSLILIGFVFSYRFFDWSMAQTVNEGQNFGNRVVHLGRNLLFKIESGKNLQSVLSCRIGILYSRASSRIFSARAPRPLVTSLGAASFFGS